MSTAEISLVVSGVAAVGSIGAVFIAYRQGRERFDHERRLSDLDAVRRVLDDAASAMQHTHSEMSSITTHLSAYAAAGPGRLWDNRLLREDSETLANCRDELDALAGRLRIRFGSEHELVTVYEGAATMALEVAYRVELVGQEFQEPKAAVEGEREKIEGAVREFGLARDSFTLIAYRVAGVKLTAAQLAEI